MWVEMAGENRPDMTESYVEKLTRLYDDVQSV